MACQDYYTHPIKTRWPETGADRASRGCKPRFVSNAAIPTRDVARFAAANRLLQRDEWLKSSCGRTHVLGHVLGSARSKQASGGAQPELTAFDTETRCETIRGARIDLHRYRGTDGCRNQRKQGIAVCRSTELRMDSGRLRARMAKSPAGAERLKRFREHF